MQSVLLKFSCILAIRRVSRFEKNIARSYASALFIPGSRASETFAFLSPCLNFDDRFDDPEKLRLDLERRGVATDAAALAKTWQFYKYMNAEKWALEHRRSEIARETKRLGKKKDLSCEEEREKIRLMTQGKVLKQDMRIIKEALWEMEERAVIEALKLPNIVDERTPPVEPRLIRQVGEISEPAPMNIKSHLDIGASLGLIDYKNSLNCYFCDEAALFELATLSWAGKSLADMDMLRISGTDFSRSLVVEASGLDHEDPSKVFVLSNNENIARDTSNRLHLVGGASLASFLAMHTKQLINPNHFPLRYFAAGRSYVPHLEASTNNGLFTICQSSVVRAFAMTREPTGDEHSHEFERLSSIFASLYDGLGVHYRTVMRSANELRAWESLRISYEMWSPYLREYIEIGHLSLCGTYLSKRLLIAYQTPTGREFPAIIDAEIVSIPKLLGCLLEEDPKKFRIPAKIAEHMRDFY